MVHKVAIALMAFALPGAVLASDYVGTLKAPQSSLTPAGAYSFSTAPVLEGQSADNGMRMKLGYKYSRFFAVEGEVVDFGRVQDPFANPGNLASAFRSTGFGVDTIAMLPVWRFSFYGRMGAYRGDARGVFGSHPLQLAGEQFTRGTRLRYGLGLRYDFTKSLGVRAELERHSPLGSPLATEVDAADQFSVGVSWKF